MLPAVTALTTLLVLAPVWHADLTAHLQAADPATEVAETVETPSTNDPASDVIRIDPEEAVSDQPAIDTPVPTTDETETRPALEETVLAEDTPARPSPVPVLDQARILERASASLAATGTAKGRFEQLNADGTYSTGTFALRRPGRVRFDYDDPVPVLIVSDGTTVAIEDSELETVDRYPLVSTPLGIILDDQPDFSDPDLEIISVSEEIGLTAIALRDATGEVDGDLTLLFESENFEFLGWIAIDSDLNTTQVSLSEVVTNERVNARLFRLEDPRDEEEER